MNELPIAQLESLLARFPGPHLTMVCASILAGNTGGRLWANDNTALLWDQGNNVLYFAGSPASADAYADVIAKQIRPELGSSYFKARAFAPELEAQLPQILASAEVWHYPSLFYHQRAVVGIASFVVAEGVTFVPIDRQLLARDELAQIDELRAEIAWMWPNSALFEQLGFGVAALVDNALVCWCTAEYVSATLCGIGIATVPAYERRGIATATGARFLAQAEARGLVPAWECRRDNVASWRVAEKLGFHSPTEESYWLAQYPH